MKLYICTDHEGHYPVGVASIVLAANEQDARDHLGGELLRNGLNPVDFTLQKISQTKPMAIILNDGNY